RPVGQLIRTWRQRRRLSQLDLACEASISTRHLSFLETGRARPSREMLLHLAEQLDIPLRERNSLLTAGGYAPVFPERSLSGQASSSTRALSFPETGAARPSREILLHLAAQLDIPLRERNSLLTAGGYAPVFPERSLADPAMAAARRAVELVLAGHEPYPALA